MYPDALSASPLLILNTYLVGGEPDKLSRFSEEKCLTLYLLYFMSAGVRGCMVLSSKNVRKCN